MGARTVLVLWARYIDDFLLLWNGSLESLETFMETLNINDRGIEFEYEADQHSIHFRALRFGQRETDF